MVETKEPELIITENETPVKVLFGCTKVEFCVIVFFITVLSVLFFNAYAGLNLMPWLNIIINKYLVII